MNFTKTDLFRFGLYTTPVALLKLKNESKAWSENLYSIIGMIGLTLPLVAVKVFV